MKSMLRTLIGGLLDIEVSNIFRLCVASADPDQCIPLLSTLVLEVDRRFLLLSYSQESGLVCNAPVKKQDLRWDREIDEGEWLELTRLEDSAEIPELPFRVRRITGWIGANRYDDVLAVVLEDDTNMLVVTTTQDMLICTDFNTARREAELVVKNHQMQIRQETLELS
jgi:hypothetical protein